MSENPQATNLYRHYGKEGVLLYVGISLNAITRLSQHKASSWFSEISDIKIQTFSTRDEALIAEAEAIRTEKPKYNMQHRPADCEVKATAFGNVRQPPRPIGSIKGQAGGKQVKVKSLAFDEGTCRIALHKAKPGHSGRRYGLSRDAQEFFGVKRDGAEIEFREDIISIPGLGDCLRLSVLQEPEPHSRKAFFKKVFEKEKGGKKNKLDQDGNPIETKSSKENPRFYIGFAAPDNLAHSRPSTATRYIKGTTEDGRRSITFLDYTLTKEELGE